MSDGLKEIDVFSEEFEKLHSLYVSMYHEELLDDSRRCEIRNNIAEEFSEAATLAADAGGYGTIEKLDIFGANPDEVYFFVESIDDKRRLIDLFRSLLRQS